MKDATVSARVECNVKNEAEDILQKLGVPVSVVINSLYRQIIYKQGIPFSLTIPKEPKTLDQLSEAEKRLDEADTLAASSTTRLSKSEVFDSVRSRINEQSKK